MCEKCFQRLKAETDELVSKLEEFAVEKHPTLIGVEALDAGRAMYFLCSEIVRLKQVVSVLLADFVVRKEHKEMDESQEGQDVVDHITNLVNRG